jgi:hypothetical protein
MPDIIDLPNLPQLPQPNIPAGQLVRVNGVVFVAANVNGNWDWCERKMPEDDCKEKSIFIPDPDRDAQVLSECPELKNLCEDPDKRTGPAKSMVCEDDPSFGTRKITVELVLGVSDLFDSLSCESKKSEECKDVKITRENIEKKFANWNLVITQGPDNQTGDVVTGKGGKLAFPMRYSLQKIGNYIATKVLKPQTECENIACDTYDATSKSPIQILSIEIPLYRACKWTDMRAMPFGSKISQVLTTCPDYSMNELRDILENCSTVDTSQLCQNARACQAAIDAFDNSPCKRFMALPLDKNGNMYDIDNTKIPVMFSDYRVRCPSYQQEILCGKIISRRETFNPVSVVTDGGDGGVQTRSKIEVNAYIESDNDGQQPCFDIPTSIMLGKDDDDLTFTILVGKECKPDDGTYTADKPTYALIKTKVGSSWNSNDFDHNHDLCEKIEPECKNVSINIKCSVRDPSKIASNQIMVDIATGDEIDHNGTIVMMPDYNPKHTTKTWYQGEYLYSAYKCKTCSDDAVQSEITKIKNNMDREKGFCCVASKSNVQSSIFAYTSRDLCCNTYMKRDMEPLVKFFMPTKSVENSVTFISAKNAAIELCLPPVDCCMPGIKNGGLCIYKPRFKPSVKFKITTEIKLCSIDGDKNKCNQLSKDDADLGRCSLRKDNCKMGSPFTYNTLLANGDFNYTDLLGPNGIPSGQLRSELELFRACNGTTTGPSYCQNVKSKDSLIESIRIFGKTDNNDNKQYKLYTEAECQSLAAQQGNNCLEIIHGPKYVWRRVEPSNPDFGNSMQRSYKSSCKDLMSGPKTESVTTEIQIDNVPTDKNTLTVNELMGYINGNAGIKNTVKSQLSASIKKYNTFKPAKCSAGEYGGGLFGCITLECCKDFLRQEIKALNPNFNDAQVEQLLGGLNHQPSSGSFLCDNYPGQRDLLEKTVPGNTLSPPDIDFGWEDITQTVNQILADTNKYKITNIEVIPVVPQNKDLKSEYLPGVTPQEGSDQCLAKANQYLNTNNASSPKDYIFVPSYTKLSQVNASVDDGGNISVSPTPPIPGSCDKVERELLNSSNYDSAHSICIKKGGKVVDNCNKCGQEEPRPDFPPPDDPPPQPNPNDPNDPNDPSNPPAKTTGKTQADLKVSVSIQNNRGAVTSSQTLSLNVALPFVVNGRTYTSLDVVRSSKVALRAVVSSVAPHLTPDQLDSLKFVGLQEK